MIYHQKDIVEIDFPIPDEGYKVHPALIVSNDELYSNNINNYKTMKAKRFFHALAASVMLAATAGLTTACTSNDDTP